jgi:hypothetical protein
MKLVKTASGKNKIKMSRSEWTNLGKKAGWIEKKAQSNWANDLDSEGGEGLAFPQEGQAEAEHEGGQREQYQNHRTLLDMLVDTKQEVAFTLSGKRQSFEGDDFGDPRTKLTGAIARHEDGYTLSAWTWYLPQFGHPVPIFSPEDVTNFNWAMGRASMTVNFK